eukprot:TRINITY_DN25175_c0_g1_i2.p1 TRINITY_DN25175_c0_g1~~TRINITY_DN25175_c0_g1_i2.p1  ORF type:complete len:189 (-),score=57.23 TRINITY_DN25175_c0_g1_i2:273-839(-)
MGQALTKPCLKLEDVLIDTILGWLTPIDKDFGPFHVELSSSSHDDEDSEDHVNLKSFSLHGVSLHGKVTADLPLFGTKELPINLDLDLNKEKKELVKVDVQDVNFDENDEAEDPDGGDDGVQKRDMFGDIGGAFMGAMSAVAGGSIKDAFMQILDLDSIKEWACDQISELVNDQIAERLGGEESDDDD